MTEPALNGGPAAAIATGVSPPFFVMGCQGSGNTLLSLMLARHSRIAVFLGSHFYPLFAPDRHRYGDLRKASNRSRLVHDVRSITEARGASAPEAAAILDAVVEPTFEGVLTAFLRAHARRMGKVRAGERTSQHYLYLREILEGFPDSPVVFTVRDPRDIAITIQEGLGTGLRGAAEAWNRAFLSLSEASRPLCVIRYEDLVRHPAETLGGICDFLGERYEPAMLRFFEQTPDEFRGLPHHSRLFQPLDDASVGDFERMNAREIAWIEASCAEGMQALGYPFTTSRRDGPQIRLTERRRLPGLVFDRARYYGRDRRRWRAGAARWKMVLRLRARYVVRLGFVRKAR